MDASNPQSYNRYPYAGNDPVNSNDPTGLFASGPPSGGGSGYGDFGSGLPGCNGSWDPWDRFGDWWGFGFTPWWGGGTPPWCNPFAGYQPNPPAGGGGGGGGGSSDKRKAKDPECNPDVIAAMKAAWGKSGNGSTGVEAGFALVGTPQNYSIVALPFTNQQSQITFTVPRGAFAIFHVHPNNGNPQPSAADDKLANADDLLMFTESQSGLWEYNPATKNTQELVSGLPWTKPCPK